MLATIRDHLSTFLANQWLQPSETTFPSSSTTFQPEPQLPMLASVIPLDTLPASTRKSPHATPNVQYLKRAAKDPLDMHNTKFLLNHVGQSPEEWAWRLYALVREEDVHLETYLLYDQSTFNEPEIRHDFMEKVYRTLNDQLKPKRLPKRAATCRVAKCDNLGEGNTTKLPFCASHNAIAKGHQNRHSHSLSGDMGRLAMFLVCYDATSYRHAQAMNCLDEWCCRLLDAYLPVERLMRAYQLDTLLSFFVRAQRAVRTPAAQDLTWAIVQARAHVRALDSDFDYLEKQVAYMSRQLTWNMARLFVANYLVNPSPMDIYKALQECVDMTDNKEDTYSEEWDNIWEANGVTWVVDKHEDNAGANACDEVSREWMVWMEDSDLSTVAVRDA